MNTKRIFIGAASLLMSFALSAAEVSSEDVELVAKGWARDNAATFGKMGAFKSVKAERDASGKVLWYWALMEKGALVVAPDTEIEPVIAAFPCCNGTLPANHPMRALLQGDLARRMAQVRAQTSSGTGGRSFLSAPLTSASAAKWQRLKERGTAGRSFMAAPHVVARPATIVKWLDGWNEEDGRITCWTQEMPFNNYAPLAEGPLGPMNAVVGCVATAGSAVLHYFRVPEGPSNIVSSCTVDRKVEGDVIVGTTNLCTKGGVYDWSLFDDQDPLHQLTLANPKFLDYLEYVDLLGIDEILKALDGEGMPEVVEKLASLDDATKEALRAFLTLYGELDDAGLQEYQDWVQNGMDALDDLVARVSYDVGVLSHMNYTAGGSGAYGFDLATALRKHFGLKSARYVNQYGPNGGNGSSISSDFYPDLVYNQIRAGSPVLFGINSTKVSGVGHEVVACGYGIDTENTDYTFIFCGWAGLGDAWYSLPFIDTKATTDGLTAPYDTIGEMIVSLSTNACYVPLVGRVVDEEGVPVTNDLRLADGTLVHPDTNGYWGVQIDPGQPDKVIYDPVGDPHPFAVGADALTPKAFFEDGTSDAVAAQKLAAALPDAMEIVVKRELLDNGLEIVSDYETAARRALAAGKLLYVFGGADETAVAALKDDFRANSNETFFASYVFWQVDASRYRTLANSPFFAGAADPRTIDPNVPWSEANGQWTAGLEAWQSGSRKAVAGGLTLTGPATLNTAAAGSHKYVLTVAYEDGVVTNLNAALVGWSVDPSEKASVRLGSLTPTKGATGELTLTAAAATLFGEGNLSAELAIKLMDGPCVIVGGCRTNTCIVAEGGDANVTKRALKIAQGDGFGNRGLITPGFNRNGADPSVEEILFGTQLKLEMQASRTFDKDCILRCVGLEVVADDVTVTNVAFDAVDAASTVAYDYAVCGAVTRVGWKWATDKYYVEFGSAGNAQLDRESGYYPAGSDVVVSVLPGTEVIGSNVWAAVWSGCGRAEAGLSCATVNVDRVRNVWASVVNVSDETVTNLVRVASTNGLVVARGYKVELVAENVSDWGEPTTYDIKVVRDDAPEPEPVEPDPIAFKSIEKVDGEWILVATNAKQWCEYALWSGTTVKTNEWTALEESDWRQWEEPFATMTNRVPEVDGEAQRFWIILARPGLKPVE